MWDSRSISSFVFCFFSLATTVHVFSLIFSIWKHTKTWFVFVSVAYYSLIRVLPRSLPLVRLLSALFVLFSHFQFTLCCVCDSDYRIKPIQRVKWMWCFSSTFAFHSGRTKFFIRLVSYLFSVRLSLVCHFCLFKASHHNRRAYKMYVSRL